MGEGEDQGVDGTATDNAGNTAATSVTDLDVDKTAPDLSAAPTTLPNEHGWYDHDVTLVWAASDGLSGLAGDAPGNSVLSSEGRGQTASATVRDLAGNRTSATSAPVDIDKTAPTTDVSAPGGWTNGAVRGLADPARRAVRRRHDALPRRRRRAPAGRTVSPVRRGHAHDHLRQHRQRRQRRGREDRDGPDRPVRAHDHPPPRRRGRTSTAGTTPTSPSPSRAPTRPTCPASRAAPTPQQVTHETAGEPVTGTATDNAGNSADGHRHRAAWTAPRRRSRAAGRPAANDAGWNNTDVTVHFDATDGLSGIDEVTADRTLGEGTDQSVEGTARRRRRQRAPPPPWAGSTSTRPPRRCAARRPRRRTTAGWYSGDVTIAWTADDDRSGVVATPAAGTIDGRGPRPAGHRHRRRPGRQHAPPPTARRSTSTAPPPPPGPTPRPAGTTPR